MTELLERYEARREEALAERPHEQGPTWLAGKTSTGGGFALRHSALHGMRRVASPSQSRSFRSLSTTRPSTAAFWTQSAGPGRCWITTRP